MQEEEDLYQKLEEKPHIPRGGYPDEMRVIVTLMTIDHVMDEDILEGEDIIRIEVEDHQIEKIIKIEGIQEEEDSQMMEEPLMMVDPLMMEDPQEMEDHQDNLEDKDHQAHQDLLDQCTL